MQSTKLGRTERQQRIGRPGLWPQGTFNPAKKRRDFFIYSCHILRNIMKPHMPTSGIFFPAENVTVKVIQSKNII